MQDYYKLLGLRPDAAPDAIRQAYRTLAKSFHPDASPKASPGEKAGQVRRFVMLSQAYDVLSDPGKKADYDRQWQVIFGAGGVAGGAKSRPSSSTSNQAPPRRESPAPEAGEEWKPEDLLRDVEDLLQGFGLDPKQPFEALLDSLLEWAKALFRQANEAWERAGKSEAESAGTGNTRSKASAERAGKKSSEAPRASGTGKAASDTGKSAGGAGKPDGGAGKSPGAAQDESVKKELNRIKKEVRQGRRAQASPGEDLDAELKNLKEHLQKRKGRGR